MTQPATALVVLGDTYFQFNDPGILDASEPAVLTGPVEEVCSGDLSEDLLGRLRALIDSLR